VDENDHSKLVEILKVSLHQLDPQYRALLVAIVVIAVTFPGSVTVFHDNANLVLVISSLWVLVILVSCFFLFLLARRPSTLLSRASSAAKITGWWWQLGLTPHDGKSNRTRSRPFTLIPIG
jgi:hypothetical protein